MKTTTAILLSFLLTILLLTACGSDSNTEIPDLDINNENSGQTKPVVEEEQTSLTYKDFSGKRIGIEPGTVFDIVAEDIGAIPVFYNEISAGFEDVRKNRLDGFMSDLARSQVFMDTPGNEDIDYVVIPDYIFEAPIAAMSMDQDVVNRFNTFLAVIKNDGTLEDMHNRWLRTTPDLDAPMLDIPRFGNGNGSINVAITGMSQPFTYIGANEEPKGFSVELALRFAAFEEIEVIIDVIDFSGYIPYIISGKTDIGIDAYYITEERRQAVLFTEPYASDLCSILYLSSNDSGAGGAQEQTGNGFIDWLKTGVERNLLMDNRWQLVLNGLGVTMIIAFCAQITGTVFGSFVCWILTRKNKFVNWFGRFYCGLIHGTPVVVLLMITYYIIFGNSSISNVIIAIVAFSMVTGASVALNLKGAIETVDPVEIEAARSIGFSAFRAFLTVTLPQAARRAMPGYTNGFVELVKATAVVGYIAIQDLTRAGDIIRSRTYDAYFPLLLVALIYLLMTTICVQIFKQLIKKINGGISL
ncbi:MAG: ABC transporter permease subunit [Oscillospiraceae bacterium]|nr:ABC transporter permease subunit [Oscillospiraceae bacterium]